MMHSRRSRIRSISIPLLLSAAMMALPAGCRNDEEQPPRPAPKPGPTPAALPPATQPAASTQPTQPDPKIQQVKDMLAKGLELLDKGQLIEADALFTRIVDLLPGYTTGHWARGKVQMGFGRHDNAIPHFQKAVRLDPNFIRARADLGISYASLGDLGSAIEQFEAIIEIDPESANAHMLLGRARAQRRQFPEALASYREAVRADPKFIPGQLALAGLLSLRGQNDQAATALAEAIRLNPKEDQLIGALASVLNEQGKSGQARTRFEQALKIKSENPDTLNNYAWFLATCPDAKFRDGARAVTLATQACELTKDTVPHFLDTLAAAQAESGQFDEAVKTAEKAVAAAEAAGDKDLAWDVRARIQLYKTRRAYHGEKLAAPTTKPAPAPTTRPASPTPPPPAKPG